MSPAPQGKQDAELLTTTTRHRGSSAAIVDGRHNWQMARRQNGSSHSRKHWVGLWRRRLASCTGRRAIGVASAEMLKGIAAIRRIALAPSRLLLYRLENFLSRQY
jgi:hypothetical protein